MVVNFEIHQVYPIFTKDSKFDVQPFAVGVFKISLEQQGGRASDCKQSNDLIMLEKNNSHALSVVYQVNGP